MTSDMLLPGDQLLPLSGEMTFAPYLISLALHPTTPCGQDAENLLDSMR